ncbi:MAG: shikimate dehydrogenase [Litorilinea sp.]
MDAKTEIVGLIGWPVSHSVSPAMQNAAFAAANLNWCFVPLPVPVEPASRVGEAILGLRALGLRGANVTVPHKQAIIPYLDRLEPAAQAIGAVNAVRVEADGTLAGDNTDAAGFIADLRDHQVDPQGKHVFVLGAGGSARAVVYGLAHAGAASITIYNRTAARSTSLAHALADQFPACTITANPPDQSALVAVAQGADLIVNCTSVGMSPHVDQSPWPAGAHFQPNQIVYDLIYNPRQTRLLQAAAAAGATAIHGLGMLVWQGAIAFTFWTHVDAPVAVMAAAVEEAIVAREA